MNWGILDFVFVALIIMAAIRGAFRGLVQELLSIAVLFLSLLLAAVFQSDGSKWIQSRSSLDEIAPFLAFIVIFLGTFLILKIFQKGIVSLINATPLESVDKMLGFFFGILEGILLSFLLVYLLNFQSIFDLSKLSDSSVLLPYLERFLPGFDIQIESLVDSLQEI